MIRRLTMSLAAALLVLTSFTGARAEAMRGTWEISTSKGAVQLQTQWSDSTQPCRYNNSHTAIVDPHSLGIAGALASSGTQTTFALHREAGDFAFEGWVGNGEGSGQYTFTANESFFNAIRARGYDVRGSDREMAFADLDITTAYIDQIESLHFKPSVNDLIAMKALDVTKQYVADLQRAGVRGLSEREVISLKAVRVNPAYIDEIARAGFPKLKANQYLTLKAMHVDAAYIKYLRSHGFKGLTVDQVVTMKAERI